MRFNVCSSTAQEVRWQGSGTSIGMAVFCLESLVVALKCNKSSKFKMIYFQSIVNGPIGPIGPIVQKPVAVAPNFDLD
jgi:hypothetical protein